MNLETFWSGFLFAVSLIAYLSFSLIAQDAVASMTVPLERRKEGYVLAPLSILCADLERLVAVLSFSRLLFVIPVLLQAYRWSAHLGTFALVSTLASLTLLLYLLPEWLRRRVPLLIFRGTVRVIAYFFYPVFWLMAKLTPGDNRKAPHEEKGAGSSEEQAEESEEFKGDILKAISTIGETMVREIMTPRVDMICTPSTTTLAELHKIFKEHKFSRLPVYKEKVDNVIGIVSVMDYVCYMSSHDSSDPATNIMRPAVFVPETKKVFTLFREFRESHAQMAIVIDEYGGTSGLITLEDMLEEIVGEIEDERDEVSFDSIREKEGSYIVTGKFPIERMEEIFGVEVAAEDFETISGLIFSILGRIPIVGEIVKFQSLILEILEADKRRIHRVRVKLRPREESTKEQTN